MVTSTEPNEGVKLVKSATEESVAATAALPPSTTTTKVERVDGGDDEEERWYLKKKAKVVAAAAAAAAAIEDGVAAVTCATVPSYYGTFHSYYSNLCESWVRNAAAAAGYHHATTWPNYSPIPFTKDSKAFYFTES